MGGERGVVAGWISAILLASSPMWSVGGHFNTLDMGLSSILSCALFSLILAQRDHISIKARRNWMWLCWAFMALAVLSKGLIGLVIPGHGAGGIHPHHLELGALEATASIPAWWSFS